jgi:TonB-linked SusC/RagA family outer membrane protein
MKKIYFLMVFSLGLIASVIAQDRTVSGRITSAEDGSPLPGVTVVVKGTTTGTITDTDGNYRLSVPQDGQVLVFSFIGFATYETEIGSRNDISIQMNPETTQLGEVVVTAVGIETNKAQLGYSIENVKADDIIAAKEPNLVTALTGKVAGVQVVSSAGSPGASANIRIRGSTSIGRSNSPLFVVDGVPISNSESGNGVAGVDQSNRAIDINPNDIQDLTVLKGPAATALYGIRAANGAIIITTKKGKEGKAVVNFNSSYSAERINKFLDLQSTYAQGRPSGGAPIWRGPNTFEGFSYGPRISDLEFDGSAYPYDQNGRLVPRGTGNGTPAQAYDAFDAFFVTGNTWDNNVSVSGGNNGTKYFMSAGALNQKGVVPKATFNRYTFRANIEQQLSERVNVGISGAFTNSGGFRIQRGSNLSGVMLGLVRNTPTFDIGNGKTGFDAADDEATYVLPDGTQRSYRAGVYDNPFWTVNKNPFEDNVNRLVGNTFIQVELTDWLDFQYKLGLDYFTDERNFAFDINPGWSVGEVTQQTIRSTQVNHDALLLYNKDFGGDINLNGTVGFNYWKNEGVTKTATGTTLAAPNYYNIANATDIVASEGIGRRELAGVFGTVNFGWKNQVFINFSGRNDWSSTLPEENRSFFYPAVSGAWTFTETFGMQDTFLPYAKIRASWGQVGNDAPIYATQSYFNSAFNGGDGFIGGTTFPAFGTNAFERSTQLGNDQLKPETTTTLEFGVELEFLDGRLGLDVTYYDAETVDQVISVDIPSTTGFTNVIQNAGVISNKGVEALLNARVLSPNSALQWDINMNWTTYETIVEELAPGVENITLAGFTSTSSRVVAGQPYGVIFGGKWQRNDAGSIIVGSNGYPLVDPVSGPIADPNPDWISGIRNTFTYKGVSLSFLLDIRQGGNMWCGTCGVANYFGMGQESADLREQTFVFDGVLEDGTPNTTEIPYADPANGVGSYWWVRYGFGGFGEQYVYSTSWVRLRDLTLAYNFPRSVLDAIKIQNMRLAFTGRNLWLSTKYPGIDPETNLTGASNGIGLDYFNMPNTKSYSVRLDLTF